MTSSVEKLIDELRKIEPDNSDVVDKCMIENKTTCRLINIHLKEFFDDIHIPYSFFRDDDWKINKILYKNEDMLYYNKKYLTEEDEERFFEVFDKFIAILEEILTPNNKLYSFLKKWTDMSHSKWKSINTRSYLKSLLIDRKYQFISPAYVTDVYCHISKKYREDTDKIKSELEDHLDFLVKNVKKEIKIFRKIYDDIVTLYVYEYPYDIQEKNCYNLAFVNSIILEILNFAEKLIDLHVYAIHPIINNIIEYYTPLDEINQYEQDNYINRKISVV